MARSGAVCAIRDSVGAPRLGAVFANQRFSIAEIRDLPSQSCAKRYLALRRRVSLPCELLVQESSSEYPRARTACG